MVYYDWATQETWLTLLTILTSNSSPQEDSGEGIRRWTDKTYEQDLHGRVGERQMGGPVGLKAAAEGSVPLRVVLL